MIFLGDIAFPGLASMINKNIHDCFGQEPIVANLEGPVVSKVEEFKKKRVLFNSIDLFDEVSQLNIRLLNLANNHVMDLGHQGLLQTEEELFERDIPHIGAGRSISEAAESREIIIGDKSYIFLSFGWEVIECIIASENKAGVNPLEKEHVLKSVAKVRKEYPNSSLIVQFHWNYELELYPQPQEREIARICIEEGAEAIIGCHSHLVQGIEIYQDAPIVYGLGNWFIPHNFFFDGKLQFPESTLEQLAVEWSPGNELICHWFKYDSETHNINFVKSELFSESNKMDDLTPYRNLSHDAYVKWFKKNRKKKKLLPIFKSVDHTIGNYLKKEWVSFRGKLIDLILSLGLKKIRSDL